MIIIFIVIVRLFDLQILNHAWYEALASGQHDVLSELIPKRGQIYIQDKYAASGRIMAAVNRDATLLYAVPEEITDVDQVAEKLSPLIDMDVEQLKLLINKPGDPYEPLLHQVPEELVKNINQLQLAGIKFTTETMRYYAPIPDLGQVTGFLGYNENLRQGQYGIEGFWEKTLAGKQGSLRAEKDVAGSLIALGKRDIISAINGSDIVLTIDYNIQLDACTELEKAVKKHGADSGSLIIMDPKSGAIKALCNAPNFDPNNYGEVENIKFFTNPVISHPYEPGSVFKPITIAAALHSGAVTPETIYEDTGQVVIGSKVIKNSDEQAHGQQTMISVLEKSLNTGAIFAMRQAGAENFQKMVVNFGFGSLFNIELPTESTGDIRSIYENNEIYLATASFGQGISVTPLQLITAYSAIANRGILMRPYIVKEIIAPDGRSEITSVQEIRAVLTPMEARTLAGMMVQVVEEGHGKRAGVPGYYVAGKTGTAQVPLQNKAGYDPDKTIGTFVGFAPVDDPIFVMLVKIDNPKDVTFAESTAAPLFGRVAKFLLDYYQVPPEREIK
ncbi:MAG: penicillin-binding protein 2 [Patescibacteria group bacterium]